MFQCFQKEKWNTILSFSCGTSEQMDSSSQQTKLESYRVYLIWRCQTLGLDRARLWRALIKGLVTLAYSSCASTNIVVEPIRFKHCLNCVFDDVLREYPQNYLKDTRRNTWSFCSQSRKWQNCWYQALNYEQKVILRTISL